MLLKEFLKENKVKKGDFAKKLHIHRNYLSSIINGRGEPGQELAHQIVNLTEGKVTLQDLIKPKGARPICPCCKRRLPKDFAF